MARMISNDNVGGGLDFCHSGRITAAVGISGGDGDGCGLAHGHVLRLIQHQSGCILGCITGIVAVGVLGTGGDAVPQLV